ncbi:hypothetical protein CAAN1_01S11606 [[Candida] anglica]|uniref:RSE1/DDB1/CPSF1 first beta-propeller domain-containing protein n=1 Tax=[Candida] anglica TaxID=148631 RepID=A0ABP0EKF3_9ASCO
MYLRHQDDEIIHVRTELQPNKQIKLVLKVNNFLFPNEVCVVTYSTFLTFFRLIDDKLHSYQYIHRSDLMEEYDGDSSVHAMTSFESGDVTKLVLFVGNSIKIVTWRRDSESFHIVETFIIKNNEFPKTIETSPILIAGPQPAGAKAIALHSISGMVTTIKTEQSKVSKLNEQWVNQTSYLGSITVLFMTFLNRPNGEDQPVLAVVYKDFNFACSLRYYVPDAVSGKFVVSRQFQEFEAPPQGIVALKQGGLLVFSDIYALYFPDPLVSYLSLDDDVTDPSLSVNSNENVLTKVLVTTRDSSIDIASLTAYTVIDSNRVLAIATSGMTFMLHFDISPLASGRKVTVRSFGAIKLNYTTPAKQVVHVDRGIFFASSDMSRSVLFSISSTHPFVHISQYFDTSPPVLNIEARNKQIFVCQGGYESGEFRNISRSKNIPKVLHKADFPSGCYLKTFENSLAILSIDHQLRGIISIEQSSFVQPKFNVLENGTTNISGYNFDTKGVHYQAISANGTNVISSSGVFENGKKKYDEKEEIIAGVKLPEIEVITTQSSMKIYIKDTLEDEISLTELDSSQIVSVKFHTHDNDFFVLLTYDSGLYKLYHKKLHFGLVSMGFLPVEGVVFSTALQYQREACLLWMFFTMQDGKLLQLCFDLEKSIIESTKTVEEQISETPLHVFAAQDGSSSPVFMYNDESIWALTYDLFIDFYQITLNPIKRNNISQISILESCLAILYSTGRIEILSLSDVHATSKLRNKEPNAMVMDQLILKSLKLTRSKYTLLLCSKYKYNKSTAIIEKKSALKLMNQDDMSEITTFPLPFNDPIDVCEILSLDDSINVVVLDSDELNDQPLSVFTIDGVNIRPRQSNFNFDTISNQKLQTITHVTHFNKPDSSLFLLSGTSNVLVEVTENFNIFSWETVSNVVKQKTFSAEVAISGDTLAISDVVAGASLYEIKEHSSKWKYKLQPMASGVVEGEPFSMGLAITNVKLEKGYLDTLWVGLPDNGMQCISLSGDETPNFEGLDGRTNVIKAFNFKYDFEDHGKNEVQPLVVAGTANGSVYLTTALRGKSREVFQVFAREYAQMSECLTEEIPTGNAIREFVELAHINPEEQVEVFTNTFQIMRSMQRLVFDMENISCDTR